MTSQGVTLRPLAKYKNDVSGSTQCQAAAAAILSEGPKERSGWAVKPSRPDQPTPGVTAKPGCHSDFVDPPGDRCDSSSLQD